jgi:hypothetical protein
MFHLTGQPVLCDAADRHGDLSAGDRRANTGFLPFLL